MTVLTIAKNACSRIGLAEPSSLMSSVVPQDIQLRSLANQEGKALAARYDWQALQTQYTFATVNGTSSYTLPTDFDRLLKDTVFNRTSRRRMVGDLTPAQWQQTQASLVTYVNPAFRIRGGSFLISPTPSSAETIAFEYITKNWCQSSESVGQAAWAADTDTGVLDEELMTLGLIWRWKKAKALDYEEDMQNYEIAVGSAVLRDGARVRIDLTMQEQDRIPHAPQVPETLVF